MATDDSCIVYIKDRRYIREALSTKDCTMRPWTGFSLLVGLVLTTSGFAQDVVYYDDAGSQTRPRLEFSADYLNWWVKDAPLPIPLLVTGSLADPRPGIL